jgi:hypothetical protein
MSSPVISPTPAKPKKDRRCIFNSSKIETCVTREYRAIPRSRVGSVKGEVRNGSGRQQSLKGAGDIPHQAGEIQEVKTYQMNGAMRVSLQSLKMSKRRSHADLFLEQSAERLETLMTTHRRPDGGDEGTGKVSQMHSLAREHRIP